MCVCFGAGRGVIFFNTLRYLHSFYFYHSQFRELSNYVTTLNNDVKNWTVMSNSFASKVDNRKIVEVNGEWKLY